MIQPLIWKTNTAAACRPHLISKALDLQWGCRGTAPGTSGCGIRFRPAAEIGGQGTGSPVATRAEFSTVDDPRVYTDLAHLLQRVRRRQVFLMDSHSHGV